MPGARERLQARREDVARDPEVALQLGEAADAEERLAHDQEGPALAEDLHRAADRTGLVLHHVTVSRWPSRSLTDTTTCCSRSARSPTRRTTVTSTSRVPAPAGSRAASSRSSRRTPTAIAPDERAGAAGRARPRASRHTFAGIRKLLALERAGALRVARSPGDLELGGPCSPSCTSRAPRRSTPASSCCPRCTRSGLRSLGPTWSRPNAFAHGVPFATPSPTPAGADRRRPRARARLRGARHPRRPRAPQRARLLGRGRDRRAPARRHPCVRRSARRRTARNLTDRQLDAVARVRRRGRRLLPPTRSPAPRAHGHRAPRSTTSPRGIGPEHVALGSDFDGCELPAGMRGAQDLPLVLDDCARSGGRSRSCGSSRTRTSCACCVRCRTPRARAPCRPGRRRPSGSRCPAARAAARRAAGRAPPRRSRAGAGGPRRPTAAASGTSISR